MVLGHLFFHFPQLSSHFLPITMFGICSKFPHDKLTNHIKLTDHLDHPWKVNDSMMNIVDTSKQLH